MKKLKKKIYQKELRVLSFKRILIKWSIYNISCNHSYRTICPITTQKAAGCGVRCFFVLFEKIKEKDLIVFILYQSEFMSIRAFVRKCSEMLLYLDLLVGSIFLNYVVIDTPCGAGDIR